MKEEAVEEPVEEAAPETVSFWIAKNCEAHKYNNNRLHSSLITHL